MNTLVRDEKQMWLDEHGWISVNTKLPELKAGVGSLAKNSGFLKVLYFSTVEDVAVFFTNGQWVNQYLLPVEHVTHWKEGELDWYDTLDDAKFATGAKA